MKTSIKTLLLAAVLVSGSAFAAEIDKDSVKAVELDPVAQVASTK